MSKEKLEQQIFQLEKQLPNKNGKAFFALKNKIAKLKSKLKEYQTKQDFFNWLAI